jgi:threonine dehydrogenase-like Zn-dependent dehydrogenase
MKALVGAPGGLQVVEQPDPRPRAGEVVVDVHSCGICGSDVHAVESGRVAAGQIPGHEFSGTIAEVGPGGGEWRPGQAVAVSPLGGCGACVTCLQDLPFLCRDTPNLGLTAPGAFAERVTVPQGQLVGLPDTVDTELGAHAEPLAVALHAIGLAAPEPGDDALVFGVGPIGLKVVMALRALGAGTIVAVGRSEGRRAAASAVGADVVLDGRETDVADYAARNGLSFSQIYECSGATEAVPSTAPVLAAAGTIVLVAFAPRPAAVDTRLFIGQNLHLVGSCAFGTAEYRQAAELLCSGAVNPDPLVSERVTLADAPGALERLRRPGHLVGVLVQPWR